MKKQQKGYFMNVKTAEVLINPYINISTHERSYLKIMRSSLARILYDLAGQNLTVKMLAIIINNIRVSDNHIFFGIDRLIKRFSEYNEESVVKSYEKLENMGFFKETSRCELFFNPEYIAFRSVENFERIKNDYYNAKHIMKKAIGKKIVEIGEIMPIPSFDKSLYAKSGMNENIILDYNYAKVKDAFFIALKDLPGKKIKVFSEIMLAIKENDKNVIVSELKIPANKETVSAVIKYLCSKEILINSVRGVYYINPKYISASSPYNRKAQAEKLCRRINTDL